MKINMLATATFMRYIKTVPTVAISFDLLITKTPLL